MNRRCSKGDDHPSPKPMNLKRKVHEMLSNNKSETKVITHGHRMDMKTMRSPSASSTKDSLQGLLGEIVEDVYKDSRLKPYHPSILRTEQDLALYVMPMARVPEDVRSSVKSILHLAWQRDTKCTEKISNLLGLTTSMNLRSGKSVTRPRCSFEVSLKDLWLIWEVQRLQDGKNPVVGALVLRRQVGGLVIEYLTALRVHGGKGFPMVQAAEVICAKEGFPVLWSAVDLSQDGRYFGVISAEEAHERWGFQSSTANEWKEMGLELYDEKNCSVRYMKKELKPTAKSPKSTGRPLPCIKGVQVMKVRGQWVSTSTGKRHARKMNLPEKKSQSKKGSK